MSPAPSSRVIALDGPSGSGKSTVARGVAKALGLPYVDTGATYRAATLAVLRAGADPADPAAVAGVVAAAAITLSTDPGQSCVVTLDGDDVTTEIRGPAVTAAVSAVSAVPAVRAQLVAFQRALVGDGAVLEGRDIGTVVAPEAPVKVYLDASPEVRAARRAAQADAGILAGGDVVSAVGRDLARRDQLDSSRATSPLAAAADAVHLDASTLSAAEVISRVLELAAAAGFAA